MCDLFSFQITFLTLTLLFSIGCWPNPATVYMSGLDAVLEERPNIRLADSQDIKEIKKEIVASLKGYKLSLKSESRVSRKEYSDYRMDYQKNYPQALLQLVVVSARALCLILKNAHNSLVLIVNYVQKINV